MNPEECLIDEIKGQREEESAQSTSQQTKEMSCEIENKINQIDIEMIL